MNIKFIEYEGIKGYTRVMYNDVKDADKENCFVDVAYSGKDIKAVLEYLFSLENKVEELETKNTQVLEVAQDRFDRIQKAIEYIEKNYYDTIEDYKGYVIATIGVEELLDILKGGNNE